MYIDSWDNACSLSYRMQNNYRYLVRNSVCYHYNVPNYVRHANNAVIYLPSRVWRRIPMVRLATVSLDILGKVTSSIPRLRHSSTSMWCVSSLSVATTHNPDPESKKKTKIPNWLKKDTKLIEKIKFYSVYRYIISCCKCRELFSPDHDVYGLWPRVWPSINKRQTRQCPFNFF